jgi:hypothetical protein
VLFIDIVGYSKLLIDEHMYLPTGDGVALVFTGSVKGTKRQILKNI